jgi:murein DD-endopeptidase MepM/ murein hydrolase activator NlpD
MIDPVEFIKQNRPNADFDFMNEVLPYLRQKAQQSVQGVQSGVQAGIQAIGDFGKEVQNFVSPLKSKFNITQKFGNVSPALYSGITQGAKHLGVDLATPKGTEVASPIAGQVKFGFDKNWGNYADVIAEDGTVYRFSHLSEQNKGLQRVAAGQGLGRTGSTGHSTGPHLDISVKKGGQYIDPMSLAWLKNFLMGGV